MKDRILVVDDEPEIADLLEVYLKNENYEVYKFYSAKDALECVETMEHELALLDIMLPDMDGFSLCRKIRELYTYPIIMLTAKDGEIDKITGLTLGADDYITKPFRPLEVMARVKAQLRRSQTYNKSGNSDEEGIVEYAGLLLNSRTHECFLDGQLLNLTPTEFSIIQILIENKGKVVSAEELFHEIWADEYYTKNNNTITVHIRHLREKMKDTGEKPKYIKTIWGVGYKIEW